MLSHHERQQLERIEEWFLTDDPGLARSLGQAASPPPPAGWRTCLVRYALDALAAVLVVLGAVTLNFGLIFVGVLVLVGAACLHVSQRANHSNPGRAQPMQ